MRKRLSESLERAAKTCQGSKIKSLRRMGRFTDFRASRIFFNEPRKNSDSVRTESATAPADSSAAANPGGSNCSRRTPWEGEAGLSSARMLNPMRGSAAEKSRSGEAALRPYFYVVSGSHFL